MGLTKISGGVIQSDNFSVGVITATSLQIGSATTIHTTGIDLGSGNITSHNINSTGIITATGVTVTGDLNVAGVLTYDDVTNIDSIGVVTARSGIHVTGVGASVGIGTDNPRTDLQVGAFGGGDSNIQLATGTSGASNILFGDGSGGSDYYKGFIKYNHSTDNLELYTTNNLIHYTGGSERLRITGIGSVGINENDPIHQLSVAIDSSTAWDSTKNISNTTNNDFIGLNIDNKNSGANPEVGIMLQAGASGSGQYTINCLRTGTNTGDLIFRTRDGGTASKEVLRINSVGRVGINSSLPASLVDIRGESAESAVVNIRSYDKSSAIKLWPSNAHDLDRWRMAFWENNSQTDGNDYPDWLVDGYGRQWQNNNLYIGRTKTFGDSPANRYNYYGTSGPGVFIYNGVDGDNTNYSAYINLRCYQNDTDDRNVIYWANGGTTTTLDYDQHQKFGVKASGRVQGMYHFFAGRVESDEGSPNSVYKTSATGVYAYEDSGEASVRMIAYSQPSSSHNSFYHETGTSSANDDVQFRVRATDGRIYSDYGASVTSGADYAESFEWADGNPNNEDRVGYSVVIVPNTDGKIGIASTTDDTSLIIGVVSGCPAVLGDSADLKWQGRYLRDEYGREIMQDVEMLVWNHGKNEPQPSPTDTFRLSNCEESCRISEIDQRVAEGTLPQWAIDQNLRITAQVRTPNPDYDPSQEYVPRSDRQEWDPVGLMGKLWLRPNQPTKDCWIKLKDGSNGLSYWLIR